MADKRDTKRQQKRLTLRFGKERPEKFGFTEDISRNGLFIKTVSPYSPNTRVYIDIITPDKGIIRVEGTVRWIKRAPATLVHMVNKCGMGIMITQIKEGKDKYDAFFIS
ncbi:MAG: hypothetical protein A2078_16020 [Nitrospirae bacterium GWC2_57_9]|nr:MAG: hypothetical protein A2078_16020 [Nitrospirae bacterium GWC2_57_9]